ncbi:hypothetical protein AB5N19_10394 [Seiridium cardinale]
MQFKHSHLKYLLQAATLVPAHASPAVLRNATGHGQYPTREIAGVAVIDTPIVRAAHDLAYEYSVSYLYKHVMRSWLFGTLILANNASLSAIIDPEVHAVSALLHDLGVAEGSPFISTDKRFEVDGAIAAREFVRNYTVAHSGAEKKWDQINQQLVWDSIALHAQPSIATYKEPVVATTSDGILIDFYGPDHGVTQAQYNAVLAEFPRDGFLSGFNHTLLWLAQTKPNTTIDTWQQPWGDYFVDGFSAVGQRVFDLIAGVHYKLIESR